MYQQNAILDRAQAEKRHNSLAMAVILPLLALVIVLSVVLTAQLASTDGSAPICGIDEHIHTAECYITEQACGLAETEPHLHAPDCYEPLFICDSDDAEHIHGSECYASALLCDLDLSQEEYKDHIHADECYAGEPVCAFAKQVPHTHGEECVRQTLLCEQPEHSHAEECYPPTDDPVGATHASPADPESEPTPEPDPSDTPCPLCGTDIQHGHADADKESSFMGFAPALGMLNGIPYNADLYNFVSGIVIRDSNGQVITNGNFFYGETYTFSITFKELDTKQFTYHSDGYLHYTLPPEIMVVFPVTNGVILLPNGQIAGRYNIDTAGNVTVKFDNVDNQGNGISQNFIDRYQNVVFTLDIHAKFTQGVNAGQILFGAGAQITVNTIKDPPVGLKVDKGASTFNGDNETVDFTIKITAVGGTLNSITLDDALKVAGDNISASGFNIPSSYFSSVVFEYQVNGTGAWTPIAPAWNGTTMRFNFGSLVLPKDHYITLRYTMPLSAVLDYLGSQGGSTRWIQRLMYNLNLNNTATGNGKDSSNTNLPPVTSQTNTPLVKTFLTKEGSVSKSGSNNIITWTMTVGDGSRILNGQAIVDTMPSIPAKTITGNITIKFYTYSGGSFSQVGTTQTIPAANGNNISGFNANTDFTYTVPASPANIHRVEFVYKTMAASSGSVFSNELSITLNGNKSKVDAGIRVGQTTHVDKSSEWKWSANGSTVTALKYTVQFTIPAGYEGERIVFAERLIGIPAYIVSLESDWQAQANGDFCAPDSYGIILSSLNVSIYPYDPNFYYYPIYSPQYEENELSLHLGFDGRAGSHLSNSQPWPYSDERVITLTYEVPMDIAADRLYSKFGTFRDYLNAGGALFNQAIYCIIRTGEVGSMETYDYFPLVKKAEVNSGSSSVFDYTVSLNKANAHSLFNAGSAVFSDTFDPRLKYVPGSLYVVLAPSAPSSNRLYYAPSSASGSLDNRFVRNEPGYFEVDFSTMYRIGTWSGSVAASSGFVLPTNSSNSNVNYRYWYTLAYDMEVHYKLQVNNDYMLDGFTAGNTAKIRATSPKYNGTWSGSASVKYGSTHVKKDIAQLNGSIIDVDIKINEAGADLVPNTPAGLDKTRFTAVDTMSGDLAFFLSTIEMYEKVSNTGNDNVDWALRSELPNGLWSIKYIDEQTIQFVLPNNTPIKIVYKALITVPTGSPATFKNEIEVYGYSDYFGMDRYVVQDSGAGVFANDLPIKLYKEDESTRARLPGATFKLYVAMSNDSVPPGGNAGDSISVGGKTFYYLLTGTDNGGVYTFYDNVHGNLYYDSGSVFMIVETAAPSGYKLPASPANRFFFVLRAMSAGDRQSLESALGGKVRVITDNLVLCNEPQTISVKIGGTKTVTGDDIPVNSSFTFRLRELQSATLGDYKPNGVTRAVHVNNVSAAGTWNFTFDEIENLQDNTTYWYEVWEENSAVADWDYDLAPRVVTVTVSGGVASVTGGAGGADTLDFTNKFGAYVDVPLSAIKNTVSKPMEEGQFRFELYTLADWLLGGAPLQEVGNEAAPSPGTMGEIYFAPLTFDEADTYVYILTETDTGEEGWNMDGSRYRVEITVSADPADGSLTAEVSFVEADENGDPLPGSPVIYDETNILLWPSFLNTYENLYGIEFPATGDKGIRIFLGIGTTILVLSIGGTLIYKKQKRGRCMMIR